MDEEFFEHAKKRLCRRDVGKKQSCLRKLRQQVRCYCVSRLVQPPFHTIANMKCCCGFNIASFQIYMHTSKRGKGILTVWVRIYLALVMAVAFFFGGIAFSSLGTSGWKSYIPIVLFFFFSLITCQGFFYNRYDYRFSKNTQSMFVRKRGNLCIRRGSTEEVYFRDIVSVDQVYDPPGEFDRNADDKYHLEIRQRTNNIIRLPIEGSLWRKESNNVRDEIRAFLGTGGVDAPVQNVIHNESSSHGNNDHHRRNDEENGDDCNNDHDDDCGNGNECGKNGGEAGQEETVELCCEDAECFCCCFDLC